MLSMPRGGPRPGAGRPTSPKTLPTFTRLLEEEHRSAQAAADAEAVTLSHWIRVAVQERLARLARKRK